MSLQFFTVHPLSSLGRPTVKADSEKLLLLIPAPLAEHLKLSRDQKLDVCLGRDSRQKAQAVRLGPSDAGGYVLKKVGRSLQLRIPELATKSAVSVAAAYELAADGSVIIDLPQPWDLVDERAISAKPAAPTKPTLAA